LKIALKVKKLWISAFRLKDEIVILHRKLIRIDARIFSVNLYFIDFLIFKNLNFN